MSGPITFLVTAGGTKLLVEARSHAQARETVGWAMGWQHKPYLWSEEKIQVRKATTADIALVKAHARTGRRDSPVLKAAKILPKERT